MTKAVCMGRLSGLVNCAGIASAERTVGKNGPHNLDAFKKTVTINLFGSFNMLRLVADAMSKDDPEATKERGGIVGMTLSIARDLSKIGIRVCTISPASWARRRTTQNSPCIFLTMIYSTVRRSA